MIALLLYLVKKYPYLKLKEDFKEPSNRPDIIITNSSKEFWNPTLIFTNMGIFFTDRLKFRSNFKKEENVVKETEREQTAILFRSPGYIQKQFLFFNLIIKKTKIGMEKLYSRVLLVEMQ